MPAKTFAEDSNNTSAAAQDGGSTNLAVIEESKQELENTDANVVQAVQAAAAEPQPEPEK